MKLSYNPFGKPEESDEVKLRKEELEMSKEDNQARIAMTPTDPNEYMMDPGRSELIRWQQDLSPELQIMGMRLRNYYQNEEGDWKPKLLQAGKVIPPLCNEICIGELIAILDPCVGRNLIMSNYTSEFIRKKLIDLSNRITLLLIANRRRFGIRMSDLTPIVGICQSTFEPTHFRCLGGNEKKYIASTHRYLHTEQEGKTEDKKTNWMGAKI